MMVPTKGALSGSRFFTILMTILLLLTLLPSGRVVSEDIGKNALQLTRADRAVEVSVNDTRITSGGISQWGPYCFGIVNRTTTVETRIKNNFDAPISGVVVNFTIYWYDANEGFSFDKGKVIHKDSVLVSIEAGKGSMSDPIYFQWVPTFAGSYIFNISAHAPGDPRPVTHYRLWGGYPYKGEGFSLTDGRWVGTQFWNCSTINGWSTYTDGGDPDVGWHSSSHPLGEGYSDLHTPDGVFWVGDENTTLAPTSGIHSLVSPVMDLRDFDKGPYDVFSKKVRPQIYLLYRYRGNLSESGPYGRGGIFHYIRHRETGGWSSWEPLEDLLGSWVNISGNTTKVIWDWAKRPYLGGELEFVGIDLGNHQGREVQIRFEYRPSGYEETGYVLDDIVLIGKQRVEVVPFDVSGRTTNVPNADPGTSIRHHIDISSRLTSIDPEVKARIECVGASPFLDMYNDVMIEPNIIDLPKDDTVSRRVNISVNVPSDAPYGPGWFDIRVLGGGKVEQLRFGFVVNSRRSITMDISGETTGQLLRGEEKSVRVEIFNYGNVMETFNWTFVPIDDIRYIGPTGSGQLEPDEGLVRNGTIELSGDSLAGTKRGYFILSRGKLPAPDLLRETEPDGYDPSWIIRSVNYTHPQSFSVELYTSSPASSYRIVEDPRENGTEEIIYDMILYNSGNGADTISLSVDSWQAREDIIIRVPDLIEMGPGEIRNLHTVVVLNYPVPRGIFNFNVTAVSAGHEEDGDNTISFTLSIGKSPISEGIFLVNGTLNIQPGEVVLGREAVVSFSVRSFGLQVENDFVVNVWLDGKVVATRPFTLSRSQDKECQIPWLFNQPGLREVGISLSEGSLPEGASNELKLELVKTVKVTHVELSISGVEFGKGDSVFNGTDMEPGSYDLVLSVSNSGDAKADIVALHVELLDQDDIVQLDFVQNLTEMFSNTTREIVIGDIQLEAERSYRLVAWLDNGERWKELQVEDDFLSIDIEVGEEPPKTPFWRSTFWGVSMLLAGFVLMFALFFYLIRRKL
ncbi:MAG: hypothetical protein ACMUIE_02380 [Thermoplasmatota archaeon]